MRGDSPTGASIAWTPSATRGPKPIRSEYRLDERGDNLATVIHTLFSDGNPALD